MNPDITDHDLGTYSPRWFRLFLDRIPSENTAAEIDFLAGQLPLPAYRSILDLCCGPGRHAHALARRGYELTGVDRDEPAIARARNRDPRGKYLFVDVRDMPPFSRPFDAAICMWASFGGFTEAENQRLLESVIANLRAGGRLVLDIYNPAFFQHAEPVRERAVDGMRIVERKRVDGDRLYVTLDYADGASDNFQWQMFSVADLSDRIAALGGILVCACSEFSPQQPPSDRMPRMQLVFEAVQPS